MSDPKGRLDALIREAKQDLTPKITEETWAALEERIVLRMDREGERGLLAREVEASNGRMRPRRARAMQIGAVVLAAAAAVAFVVKDPGPRLGATTAAQPELASSLRGAEGEGEIRVDGVVASAGHELREGDLLEADGARALLERARKVTWLLEHDGASAEGPNHVARARVKSAGESLVLDLEEGAIEAQVTPVPSGEAFAVDVAAGTKLVRVAVHGTHLRVTRSGSHVVIDLNEGVVSIGVPPRAGSTYGTLVTAPSHVEFDAADLEHTLHVDHAALAVRPPVALAFHEPSAAVHVAEAPREIAALPGPAPASSPAPHPAAVARPVVDPSRVEPSAASDPARPALAPRDAIARAVRDCAAAHSRPSDVRVTVTSSLNLKVAATGSVEAAQFDPPLLPEIQTCAASTIYKVRIADASGASVTIPIEFSY